MQARKYDPNAEVILKHTQEIGNDLLRELAPVKHGDLASAAMYAGCRGNTTLELELCRRVRRQLDILKEMGGDERLKELGAPDCVFLSFDDEKRTDDDDDDYTWMSKNCTALAAKYPDDPYIKEFYQLHQMRLMVE